MRESGMKSERALSSASTGFSLAERPVEISRRCTTLLTTVAREFELTGWQQNEPMATAKVGRGKEEEEEVEDVAPPKKKAKNGVKVSYPNMHLPDINTDK